MSAADTATVLPLPPHAPDPTDGCIVTDQFVAFCADPDRDPVVEYGVRHHGTGFRFRTDDNGAWNRGFDVQRWVSAGMFLLVLDIFVFLLLVLSLTSVAKPPKTQKEHDADDDDKHRRGGMNRHNVGDASTHARSRKLDVWHRYGGATMLLGVVLLIAGTVFTAMALGSAMDVKSGWLQGKQTCNLAGWTRVKGEELDGAPMWVPCACASCATCHMLTLPEPVCQLIGQACTRTRPAPAPQHCLTRATRVPSALSLRVRA